MILQWKSVMEVCFALRLNIKVMPLDVMSSDFDVAAEVLSFLARAFKVPMK